MKNLAVTLIVVNLLTVAGWLLVHRKSKQSVLEYTANNTNPDYKYEIMIARPWWQLFFMDEYFTPQFKITVKNVGKYVERGTLGCYLAEHDEVSTFPSVRSFKDFQHFELNDFKPGEGRDFDAVIRSKFLKPRNYMLRLLIEASASEGLVPPREQLLRGLEKVMPNRDLKPITDLVESHWKSSNIDPDKPVNTVSRVAVYDFRWLEVIKVRPTVETLGVMVAILGVSVWGGLLLVWRAFVLLFRRIG